MQGLIIILLSLVCISAGVFLRYKGDTYSKLPVRFTRIVVKCTLPAAALTLILIITLAASIFIKVGRVERLVNNADESYASLDYAQVLAESLKADTMYAYFTSNSEYMDLFSGVEEPEEPKEPVKPANVPAYVPVVEDAAAATLRTFYTYLSSLNNYNRAMNLLDENFTLSMGLLRQFGIETLYKSDIDAESTSEYTNILNNAKISSITQVNTTGNTSRIFYKQLIIMDEGLQSNSKLVADLKLINGTWKIMRVLDQSRLN